ncbi:ABC transporter G family member 20-like [Oppia nitens]|uniref:ABC transporter G family member 20-like n=1 Tax=Oppia nitens TaxID=1686743 RepID=UPI0023DCD028|nr:ABC transporter G family member 20-like [Oppia nitens]
MPILNGIELTVPKDRIYGLLGPSGCGKTTLLKCILGRLRPNSGDISIFGGTPHECRIPGAGVGYMPQELALYYDFTIEELLIYFGRIFAMNRQEMVIKIDELIQLLQLPKKNTLIGKISGGQQRRTSLACALIHCPPLLILDEPTVGTDPLLRQTIWYHLLGLCQSGLTIILTTHYIEEARSADTVAFMRNGKILAEDSPNRLLQKYSSKTSLEEVFLQLCHLDSDGCGGGGSGGGGKRAAVVTAANESATAAAAAAMDDTMKLSMITAKTSSSSAQVIGGQLSVDDNPKTSLDGTITDIDDLSSKSSSFLTNNTDNNNTTTKTVSGDGDITISGSGSGAVVLTIGSSATTTINPKTMTTINTTAVDDDNHCNSVYVKIVDDDDNNYNDNSNCQTVDSELRHRSSSKSATVETGGGGGCGDCSEKLLLTTTTDTTTATTTTVRIKNSRFTGRCWALLAKNFRRLSRNWGQLVFFIILPALELALLLVSISSGPIGLDLAVFDEERVNNRTAASNNWGKLFIDCLDDNRTFNIRYFDTFDAAYHSVQSGQSYALIDINERFSKALRLRYVYGNDVDEETVSESQIRVHIDWSNQALGAQIERIFYEAIKRFAEAVAIRSQANPESIKIPLAFERPVYGSRDESMRDYVLPGCYVLLAFFATSAVTGHLIMDERRDGLLERSLVAGITAFEFLLSHTLTQFLILCLQIAFMLLMPFLLFHRQLTGPLWVLIALALSQGFCGIAFGLMISALCSDIIYAAMFVICMFFVSIIIGGCFWPIENMPLWLRYWSYLMPSTIPIQSMRAILFREWTVDYFQVYIGFIVTYVWFAVFVIVALIFLRRSL